MFRSYTQKVLTIVVSISCKRGVIYCLKYETSYGQKLKLSRIFYRTHKFQIRIAYFSPFISLQHTEWSKSSPNTVSPYLLNSEQKWAQSIFRQFAVTTAQKKIRFESVFRRELTFLYSSILQNISSRKQFPYFSTQKSDRSYLPESDSSSSSLSCLSSCLKRRSIFGSRQKTSITVNNG